jgi:hypothetical protein
VFDSVEFYNRLGARFECTDPEFLEPGGCMTFTGIDISKGAEGEDDWYYLSQSSETQELLDDLVMLDVQQRESPMPDRRKMFKDSTEVSTRVRAWCRTAIGAMNFLSRAVRWDISHSVSRVSSQMSHPVAGTVAALEHLCGYLKHTAGFRIAGRRSSGPDSYSVYTDSDHHGDPLTGTRSHTGVTVMLNGTPVFWRSNQQKGTPALSPMEAEIYALSESVRDAQDVAWVLEEMGCSVSWPLPIFTDSDGALSFQWNSCPK